MKYLTHTKNLSCTNIAAKSNVEINIERRGLVTCVYVDGNCVLRVIKNGLLVPIAINDHREREEKDYLRYED